LTYLSYLHLSHIYTRNLSARRAADPRHKYIRGSVLGSSCYKHSQPLKTVPENHQ